MPDYRQAGARYPVGSVEPVDTEQSVWRGFRQRAVSEPSVREGPAEMKSVDTVTRLPGEITAGEAQKLWTPPLASQVAARLDRPWKMSSVPRRTLLMAAIDRE